MVTRVEFGFDLQHLFVRVEAACAMNDLLARGIDLRIRFLKPAGLRIVIPPSAANVRLEQRSTGDADWRPRACAGLAAAVDRILEVRIPFASLGVTPHDRVAFLVSLTREGVELELHPRHGPIEIDVPDEGFASRSWTA